MVRILPSNPYDLEIPFLRIPPTDKGMVDGYRCPSHMSSVFVNLLIQVSSSIILHDSPTSPI